MTHGECQLIYVVHYRFLISESKVKMKILYITLENLSLHRGSVVHIKEIVTGLRRLGHQVGLVASSWNKFREVDHFYNLHHMPDFLLRFLRLKRQPYWVSSIFLFLHLLKILHQYDIIYARDFHTVIIALFPRLIFKKKLIFEVNGIANEEQGLKSDSILNRIFVFLIRKAEEMATKHSESIISVTSRIGAYLVQNYNCSPHKVKVVANGVDTKRFHPIHDDALLEIWGKKLGIKSGETVIGFVGNIAPWQGVDILIESALRLLAKNETLKFLIVGEGFLRPLLMDKVSDSGFKGNIIFTGMVKHEDIPFLINLTDICVAPFVSRRNRKTGTGSPIKVFEYLACGKPIVSSKFEGLEFIEAEGVGRLTEPEDIICLEEALNELIKDPQMRANMGQRGAEIARERHDWEWSVKKIEEVLKGLA
jgi:glycosyltransferase involved in cell wall biosynthesis